MNQDTINVKEQIGKYAAQHFVESGMKIGAGTGSTTKWFLLSLGERIKAGELRDILAVPTSSQSVALCREAGIPLRTLDDPDIQGEIDVAFDGADEVDGDHNLTKGGGGALTIEKIVAHAAKRLVILVDDTKLVDHLGITFPIAVEFIAEAQVPLIRSLTALGARPELREAKRKMGAVITDNGHQLLDLHFDVPFDPRRMEIDIKALPGVVDNGLFTRVRSELIIGRSNGRIDSVGAPK